MKPRTCLICVVAGGLLLALSSPAFADPPSSQTGRGGPPPEVAAKLLERGWHQVTPGIFQRPVENSVGYETIAYGADGMSWLLRVMEAKLQSLEGQRRDEFSPDLEDAITAYQALVQRTRETLEETLKEVDSNAVGRKDACDTSVHRLAEASPGSIGPAATGEASFTETCGEYGETTVITYAEGSDGVVFNTRSQTCSIATNPGAGGYGSGSCAAAIDDLAATSLCYSSTTASVEIDYAGGPVVWYLSDDNHYCILLSAVAITGTTSLYVPPFTCRSASWSATATGGTAPLTYSWLYEGVPVGSNSTSYGKSYCNTACNPPCYNQVYHHTVSVVVDDQAGDQVSDSHAVTITYGGRCNSASSATKSSQPQQPHCPTTLCACQIPNQEEQQ